jgi:hypothetical protein
MVDEKTKQTLCFPSLISYMFPRTDQQRLLHMEAYPNPWRRGARAS